MINPIYKPNSFLDKWFVNLAIIKDSTGWNYDYTDHHRNPVITCDCVPWVCCTKFNI